MSLKFLLFPFSLIYLVTTSIRNGLYNLNIFPQKSFKTPTIVIGNLSTGGVGKTPHTEYLVGLFKDSENIAILSRGYKRKTKGFVLAKSNSTTYQIGDEPYQMYKKLDIPIAVCEQRVIGIERLLALKPNTSLIILDDAFQHRALKATVNIIITPFHQPFFKDFILPMGNLREARSGAKRADIIIVSKCPKNISEKQKELFIKKLKSPRDAIFFSFIKYDSLKPIFNPITINKDTSITLVTGIKESTPLRNYLAKSFAINEHIEFNDHHYFTINDIKKIVDSYKSDTAVKKIIVTTEKDFSRLEKSPELESLNNCSFYYLPIKIEFSSAQSFHNKLKKLISI